MRKLAIAAALSLAAASPAFSQVIIDEEGNGFACCGLRALGNVDAIDESSMGPAFFNCDPGTTNCMTMRGQVSVTVSGQTYGSRYCTPTRCWATLPNPPVFYNATKDTSTGQFIETKDANGNLIPVTDNNGQPLVWTCAGRWPSAPVAGECMSWQLASTMQFLDPNGYGTLHFHLHGEHSSDTVSIPPVHVSQVPNPNYVPPPPPPCTSECGDGVVISE